MSAPSCPECEITLTPDESRPDAYRCSGCGQLWAEPTEGEIGTSELLSEVGGYLQRYIVFQSNAQPCTLALWLLHAHALDAAEMTPYLTILAPEKRSGKTRVLEVLEQLAPRPWRVVSPSEAVLYRKISAHRPTALIDEIDALFGSSSERTEPLRTLLNAGNARGVKVPRCGGANRDELHEYEVFCAKVLAGIDNGRLPDTVRDRSIVIRLERKAPTETVERFRQRDAHEVATPIREALEGWARANTPSLRGKAPPVPESLPDRAADGWEPLIAIADLAGDDWPERARRAAVELSGGGSVEEDSVGVRLLEDVRGAFNGSARLSTSDLLQHLWQLEESPWAEWYGKPLSPRGLSKLLRPYQIRSRTVRLEDGATPKGFQKEQFEPAWSRYLPHDPGSQRHIATPGSGNGVAPDSVTPQGAVVADDKSAASPHGKRDVADVADQTPLLGEEAL